MRLSFRLYPHTLHFKFKAGTSRGWYSERSCFYLSLERPDGQIVGCGECAPLPDLSPELPSGTAHDVFTKTLQRFTADLNAVTSLSTEQLLQTRSCCQGLNPGDRLKLAHSLLPKSIWQQVADKPALLFALETLLLHALCDSYALFDTPFARGEQSISINGLIWMGDYPTMRARLLEKLKAGFNCIKIKIGAIDFKQELNLLKLARAEFPANQLCLRADANGAFSPQQALPALEALAKYELHSVEQPIKAGQPSALAALCHNSPLPIALDEELIGLHDLQHQEQLLDTVQPHYLVLKPSLHGGISGCTQWLQLAHQHGAGAWITSALESAVGLNAVAQLAAALDLKGYQGLGTGQLFTNNLPFAALELKGERMSFIPQRTSMVKLREYLDDLH